MNGNGGPGGTGFSHEWERAHLQTELAQMLRLRSRPALEALRVELTPQNLAEQLADDALAAKPPLAGLKSCPTDELSHLVGAVVTDYLREFVEQAEPAVASNVLGDLASDITETRVEWLEGGLFPRGKQSEINGDPGGGKTFMLIEFAARISRSPLYSSSKVPVAILSGEDDGGDTLIPRLRAAHADLTRVRILRRALETPQGLLPITFPGHFNVLEDCLRADGTVAGFVDPVTAFISDKFDSHKDGSIRKLLAEIEALAERTRCAIVSIRHLNKMSSVENALYRGGGSIAFTGAARTSYLIGFDPTDNEPGSDRKRVLACVKNNLAVMPPSRAFRLIANKDEVAHVEWCQEPCNLTATDLLSVSHPREAARLNDAIDLLKMEFEGGDISVDRIRARGRELGISNSTLDRARKKLRATSYKAKYGGGWFWTKKRDNPAGLHVVPKPENEWHAPSCEQLRVINPDHSCDRCTPPKGD